MHSRAPDAAQRVFAVRYRAGAHASTEHGASGSRLCAAAFHAAARPGHGGESPVCHPRNPPQNVTGKTLDSIYPTG